MFDIGYVFPTGMATGASPERLGVSPQAVRDFLDAIAQSHIEVHSFLVARAGQIAAQGWWRPYRAQAPQLLYSLSKSFTSTAVGFAVADGRLKLSDKVIDFFPDQRPKQISENLAALRVEHLLTMSVGHASDSTPSVTHTQDWVTTFLSLPIEFRPGTAFLYDSAASYMLSAIVQKVSGQKLVDYLRPRFFEPLGLAEMRWAVCPKGINTGGWGLSATTDAVYRFGQFYLQKGLWKGRQLLPAAWIEQATSFKIQQPAGPQQNLNQLKQTSDWHQGYAYQFWRCRHNAYRGDGAFGQFCVVLPDLDAVIVITSRTLDMQGLLNLVWDHLLPGIHNAALPADVTSRKLLQSELDKLQLSLPSGADRSPKHTQSVVYTVEPNALEILRVALEFQSASCRITFATAHAIYVITCGIRQWIDGETLLPGTPPEFTELVGAYTATKRPAKLAAACAWTDQDTLQMQWRYYETPHFDTVTVQFNGDRMALSFLNSITQLSPVHAETRPVLKATRRS